MSLKSD